MSSYVINGNFVFLSTFIELSKYHFYIMSERTIFYEQLMFKLEMHRSPCYKQITAGIKEFPA